MQKEGGKNNVNKMILLVEKEPLKQSFIQT